MYNLKVKELKISHLAFINSISTLGGKVQIAQIECNTKKQGMANQCYKGCVVDLGQAREMGKQSRNYHGGEKYQEKQWGKKLEVLEEKKSESKGTVKSEKRIQL